MIDITKPIQLRNGRKARILSTDLKRIDGRTLAIAYESKLGDGELIDLRFPSGLLHKHKANDFDVVNVPERVSVFGGIFADGSFGSIPGGFVYPQSIDKVFSYVRKPKACLEVVFEDGIAVDAILHKGE